MKLKFVAMVATAEVDAGGEKFSIPELETLREQAVGKQVSVNFLHVLEGEVETAILTNDNKLLISGWLELDRSVMGAMWEIFAVPGYQMKENADVVDKLVEFGLTYNPVDTHLTPVKFSEFGG